MTTDQTDRDRLVRVETEIVGLREDVTEVKSDQKRLLWIVVGYGLASGIFQYLNAGGHTAGLVGDIAKSVTGFLGLA